MDDKKTDLYQLKTDLHSGKWETALDAADRLSQLNTTESIDVLIDGLSSTNSFIRNASALGIRDTDSKKAFDALFNRIKELWPNEEIGTLVYCLETANCNDYLIDLIDFYFNGSFEVKSSITTIFNEQNFVQTKDNINRLQDILKLNNTTIQDFNINITST